MRDYKYHEDTDCFLSIKAVDPKGQAYTIDAPDNSYDRVRAHLHWMPHQRKIDTMVDMVRGYDPYTIDEITSPDSCGSSYYDRGNPAIVYLPEWED